MPSSSSISVRSIPGRMIRAPGTDGQPGEAVVALDRQLDHPPAGRPLDLAERPADDDPAAIDDRDRLAHRLDRLHLVGREDQRPALVAELEERLAQERDVDRVETGERLVHEQDRRVVEDRGDQLDLLLVALAAAPRPCARRGR